MIRHMVSFSTGKDSAAAVLCGIEEVGPENMELVIADTGNEADQVWDYLDYFAAKVNLPVKILRADFTEEFARKRENLARIAAGEPESEVYRGREFDYPWDPESAARALELLHPTGNPYLDLCMVRGGFPSRKRQFCTEYLKRNPIVEYQDTWVSQGWAVWSWQGVRANESNARAHLACPLGIPSCDKGFEVVGGGLYIRRPIIRWTAEDCFETLRYFGIRWNPLYEQGFGRVGCFPCINSNKAEIANLSRRFPEAIERIAEWERLVSQVTRPRCPVTFFHVKTTGKQGGGDNRIHEVVKWAKTSRGGKQYHFLDDLEDSDSGCSSSYGLCEVGGTA